MKRLTIGLFAVGALLLSSCFGSKMTSAGGGEVGEDQQRETGFMGQVGVVMVGSSARANAVSRQATAIKHAKILFIFEVSPLSSRFGRAQPSPSLTVYLDLYNASIIKPVVSHGENTTASACLHGFRLFWP